MAQQMPPMGGGAAGSMFGPGQDPDKMFQNEAENLEVMDHQWILEGVEHRLLKRLG
jgi:hypothetical protein